MKDDFDGYVMSILWWHYIKSPILFFYISIQYILFVFLCRICRILDKYFVSLFFYFRYHNFLFFGSYRSGGLTCLINHCRYEKAMVIELQWAYSDTSRSQNSIPAPSGVGLSRPKTQKRNNTLWWTCSIPARFSFQMSVVFLYQNTHI